jgi:hypothetical protein
MKKIAISLLILLAITLVSVFVWQKLDRVTITGQKDIPEEDLQWVPTFAELYDGMNSEKQQCLRDAFGDKVDVWRAETDKYFFHSREEKVIEACIKGF